jgi:hypothetical protein
MERNVASEILAAHADRLNQGEDASEEYIRLLPEAEELAHLMALAARVKTALAPVAPVPRFREELRRDLLAAARQREVGSLTPVWMTLREDAEQWVDYARRRLPDLPTPAWAERPVPRGWVIAALGITGAGVWAYLRHRAEPRRDQPTA